MSENDPRDEEKKRWSPEAIAATIDHTYLKGDATAEQIRQLCKEARQYGFYSVCVNSCWVSFCRELLAGSEVKISAVCGFPLGAMATEVKAYEAAYCVEQGADELDMVISIGMLKQQKAETVLRDIKQVVAMAQGKAIVKVILETGLLTEEQIIQGCQLSEQAGAHFVKTSTGFGPRGASLEDIARMKSAVSERMQIKASGGVRDFATAVQMIKAGAHRLGTSSGVAIVSDTKANDGY